MDGCAEPEVEWERCSMVPANACNQRRRASGTDAVLCGFTGQVQLVSERGSLAEAAEWTDPECATGGGAGAEDSGRLLSYVGQCAVSLSSDRSSRRGRRCRARGLVRRCFADLLPAFLTPLCTGTRASSVLGRRFRFHYLPVGVYFGIDEEILTALAAVGESELAAEDGRWIERMHGL